MNKYYAIEVYKLSEEESSNADIKLHVFESKIARNAFITDYFYNSYGYCYNVNVISAKEAKRFLSYRLTGNLTFKGTIDDLIEQGVESKICIVH